MKSSITKHLMAYLRKFILCQNSESINSFSTLLLTFWSEFHEFVWSSNKSFASFQGNELSKFNKNIPQIIVFLTEEFGDTQHLRNLIKMLHTWHAIPSFLGITNFDNVEWYENELLTFEKNVKTFYEVGSHTFLTNSVAGDKETFYLHV